MTQTLKAVIYTRVSTDGQADKGTSLDAQEYSCLKKAAELGAEVVKVHSDPGVSGALYLARPGIQAALRDIEDGVANTLIIAKLDRTGRDVDVVRDIRNRVEAAGARIVFADGLNFESNATGKLMFTQMAAFAEFEKELIKERTMSGRRRRAEEGVQPSRSRSPFGYHVVTKDDLILGTYSIETLGTYQIVEEQAYWVRYIFAQYAKGSSLTKLSHSLQIQGIPAPRGGRYWRRCTIQRILTNPAYMGKPAFGRFQVRTDERRAELGLKVSYVIKAKPENYVHLSAPALVDESVYLMCQEKLSRGRPETAGNPRRIHTLTGILRCPKCGKKMQVKRVKRTTRKTKVVTYDVFYHCPDSCASANSAGHVCYKRNIPATEVERLVCSTIQKIAQCPELTSTALAAYRKRTDHSDIEAQAQRLKTSLQEMQTRERAVIQAQVEGIMAGASIGAYTSVLKEISERREVIETQLKQIEGQRCHDKASPKDEAALLTAVMKDVEEALFSEELTPVERRNCLQQILQEVTPNEGEESDFGVTLRLRSPLSTASKSSYPQIVSIISTLARGTVTSRPSASLAFRTRTHVSDSTCVNSEGSPVTVPSIPK